MQLAWFMDLQYRSIQNLVNRNCCETRPIFR